MPWKGDFVIAVFYASSVDSKLSIQNVTIHYL